MPQIFEAMKWCPVYVFYVSVRDNDERCPKCDGELEHGDIPKYMVSSVV